MFVNWKGDRLQVFALGTELGMLYMCLQLGHVNSFSYFMFSFSYFLRLHLLKLLDFSRAVYVALWVYISSINVLTPRRSHKSAPVESPHVYDYFEIQIHSLCQNTASGVLETQHLVSFYFSKLFEDFCFIIGPVLGEINLNVRRSNFN